MKGMVSVGILIVLLSTPVFAAGEGPQASPQKVYQEGLSLYNSGKLPAAVAEWCKVLEVKPDSDTTQAKAIIALTEMVKELSAKVEALEAAQSATNEAVQVAPDSKSITADTLTVRDIKVVDQQNRTRIELKADSKTKASQLTIFDPSGVSTVSLGLEGDVFPYLNLCTGKLQPTELPGVSPPDGPQSEVLICGSEKDGGGVYLTGPNGAVNAVRCSD